MSWSELFIREGPGAAFTSGLVTRGAGQRVGNPRCLLLLGTVCSSGARITPGPDARDGGRFAAAYSQPEALLSAILFHFKALRKIRHSSGCLYPQTSHFFQPIETNLKKSHALFCSKCLPPTPPPQKKLLGSWLAGWKEVREGGRKKAPASGCINSGTWAPA